MARLVFIGDSLTEYFDWQQRFPEHRVVNLGIAGETVEGLLGRMDRIILGIADPDIIFIMTGINNIAMEDYDIAGVYRQVVNRLFSSFSNRMRLVIQSVLPVELPWIDNRAIEEINESLKELAKDFMADYLDVYRFFVEASGTPDSSLLLDDGVHLSSKGYEVWSKAVEEFLD
jgi:lysophospholipase L1-like esterase